MMHLILLFLSIVLEAFPISSSGSILFMQMMFRRTGLFFGDQAMLDCLQYIAHGAIGLTLVLFFFPAYRIFFTLVLRRFSTARVMFSKLLLAGFITELITVACWLVSTFITVSPLLLSLCLLQTTCMLAYSCVCREGKGTRYNGNNAVLLGIAQGIAVLPGLSRFGTTFVVARWLGFSARRAFQLSFLILAPVSFASFGLGVYKLYTFQILDLLNLQTCLVMLLGSGIAFFCFQIVNKLIERNALWLFSMYTAGLAFIVLLVSYLGFIS